MLDRLLRNPATFVVLALVGAGLIYRIKTKPPTTPPPAPADGL